MEQGIDIFTTAQLVFYICGICDKYDYYSIAKGKDGITAVEAIEYSSAARAKVSWTKYSSLLLNQVHSQTVTNYSHCIHYYICHAFIPSIIKEELLVIFGLVHKKSFCSNNFVPLYLLACCLNCFFYITLPVLCITFVTRKSTGVTAFRLLHSAFSVVNLMCELMSD
jgi:hypothetical protein